KPKAASLCVLPSKRSGYKIGASRKDQHPSRASSFPWRKDAMRVHAKDFRVREGNKIDLKEWTTRVDPYYRSKKQYKKILREHITEMSALQNLLYASKSYAVLIIFQGMDAAGKD